MDASLLTTYKTISEVQSVIASAKTLDEALHGSLKAIVENA